MRARGRSPRRFRASPPSRAQSCPPASKTAQAEASVSSSLSIASGESTEIVFTLRSIRFTSPDSTLPGPISTNVFAPSFINDCAACVKRTGAVSCSRTSGPIRFAFSTRAVTVDMNGAVGSLNLTLSSAGRKRSAALATSGEWNAPETRSLTARRELADRVTDDEVGLDPALANRGEEREARGDQRRLLHLGVDELDLGRIESEVDEIEPRSLARALEDLHRVGIGLRDRAAHARLERALAGE